MINSLLFHIIYCVRLLYAVALPLSSKRRPCLPFTCNNYHLEDTGFI